MAKKTKDQKTVGELIYGIHPVVELLKAKKRKLITIYTTKPTPKGWSDIEKLMPHYPVPIQYVTRDILTRMVNSADHQGVVAWAQIFPFRKKFFEAGKQKFLVLLDGIQDPRNLGAILRSAYCAGADGAIITQKHSAPLSATAIKASAGLAERMEIFVAPSIEAAAQELTKAGYKLYLAAFGGKNAAQCSYDMPLCLVIGSEGQGISKNIYQYGTQITLPQRTSDISYNASVAAGILLFLIATQHGRI